MDTTRNSSVFAVLACALSFACAAVAEQVKVAECERDSSVDVWAAPDVRFCNKVMGEVFALAGVEPVRSEFDAEGMLVVSNAEVVCSAFRTPKLLEDYDFPLQPLGRMHFALYASPDKAEMMMSVKASDWPRIKVAYSPVSQGRDSDREEYFRHLNVSPKFMEYPSSSGAVEALRNGEVDLLFLYTPYGKRPEGLEEVVPIGMRNIYFAVRKDRPDLFKRLTAAYRTWYIDNIDKYDQWRWELLGIPKPANRVRFAVYQRGDLFTVSPTGVRSGIIEDWIRSICAFTHWTPDYVYGAFNESMDDVKSGRLDVIGGMSFSTDRREYFLYPHTPIGILRIYLWAHKYSPYEAGKPATWRGMRVGLLSGTYSGRKVMEQLQKRDYGLTIKEYDSDIAMCEAYFNGEVDAIVDLETSEFKDERALRLYSSSPMYFVCPVTRKDLFDQMEAAMDSICDDFPKYMRLISEHHFGLHSEMSEFTIAETDWIEKRKHEGKPIWIDFSPWPFPLFDHDGAEFGLPGEVMKILRSNTGLDLRLAPQTGLHTAEAKFLRGDTDFWVPYPARAESALYGARSVFATPVPQKCNELYGANDFRAEFEVFTHRDMPNELVSIINKTLLALDPMQFQEMFMESAARRMAARTFLGLSDRELKELLITAGVAVLVLILIYSMVMMRLLRRQAKKAEAGARVAEEFANAKTRFLAMMSHELRTPLNAVIGFAEFLAKEKSGAHTDEYIEGIIKSATALLDLINDILDFSKLEAGAMRMHEDDCDVEAIISELPAIFGYRVRQHGVTLEVHNTGGKVPMLRLSRQGLRQVLLNLVGNSSKFTGEGKIVVEYRWLAATCTLHIEIYDTGCGMSKEKLDRLFDPFQQDIASRMHAAAGDETKGTGLGLPIVKKIVDSAGGHISVESAIGEGTHFIIDFPHLKLSETPEQRPAAAAAAASAQVAEKPVPPGILVVDDMAMNRKILGIHLANLGVKDIRFAENGKKALETMKDWQPDAVLTDMWMPEMDGAQLSEAMKADTRLKNIPIVAVTADVDVESTYDMQLFAAIVAKPVTGQKLRKLFQDL